MKLDVKNLSGKAVGSIELPEDLFAREVRKDLLQRTVKWQLAGARAGTAHTMTRGEVDRTKAKWFRQKG
ncbi:MAG: 50S ribosomal protein L4, partial [Alphaproteobacteria bacterium CG_4_10_14_0_8_um_filter_53_9]